MNQLNETLAIIRRQKQLYIRDSALTNEESEKKKLQEKIEQLSEEENKILKQLKVM